MKLTDTALRALKPVDKVQKLSDGGGLYLHVTPTGSKLWRMAYRFEGKQKLLSFGAYPTVSLRDARKYREEAKEQLAKGIDPGAEKREAKAAIIAKEQEERDTFAFVAREWFAKYGPALSPKHEAKLRRYLENTLFPNWTPYTLLSLPMQAPGKSGSQTGKRHGSSFRPSPQRQRGKMAQHNARRSRKTLRNDNARRLCRRARLTLPPVANGMKTKGNCFLQRNWFEVISTGLQR